MSRQCLHVRTKHGVHGVHDSPSQSIAVYVLATRTATLPNVHVCLDLRKRSLRVVWLIHWLLGRETTGLRKLGLGL